MAANKPGRRRLLFPRADVTADADDLKSRRLAEKVAEAKAKGGTSLLSQIFTRFCGIGRTLWPAGRTRR